MLGLKDLLKSVDEKELAAAQDLPEALRLLLYDAIDRMPARWGTWGKFVFTLFIGWRLRRIADRWIADMFEPKG